jgi:surfeit locus 1 family protein
VNSRFRELLWPAVASVVVFLLLLGLGFWQLKRLAYKETLIATIAARATNAPSDLPPPGEWLALLSDDYDYRHVKFAGSFDLAREALIFSAPPRDFGVEPGFFVLTPFRLESGGTVLVNRGFIPQSAVTNSTRKESPKGDVTLTGVMRAPQKRNAFTPEDDPGRGRWFTSDAPKIAGSLELPGVAPFTVTLDAAPRAPVANGAPRPAASDIEVVNNHLSYAFTWFGLAAALAVIFLLYARNILKRPSA